MFLGQQHNTTQHTVQSKITHSEAMLLLLGYRVSKNNWTEHLNKIVFFIFFCLFSSFFSMSMDCFEQKYNTKKNAEEPQYVDYWCFSAHLVESMDIYQSWLDHAVCAVSMSLRPLAATSDSLSLCRTSRLVAENIGITALVSTGNIKPTRAIWSKPIALQIYLNLAFVASIELQLIILCLVYLCFMHWALSIITW